MTRRCITSCVPNAPTNNSTLSRSVRKAAGRALRFRMFEVVKFYPLRYTLGAMQYQERFSETHEAEMYDAAGRELKAAKVIAILEDTLGDLRALRLLDLGCSNGLMTRFYGERFKIVIGVDFDQPGIEYAIANNKAANIEYRVGDAMATGLPDGSVDIVTCTHVYEHVPDAVRMMDEIYR